MALSNPDLEFGHDQNGAENHAPESVGDEEAEDEELDEEDEAALEANEAEDEGESEDEVDAAEKEKWKLKARKLLDQPPVVPDSESGFPAIFKGQVIIGKCIPINKKTWNDIDIDGDDAILDCASQVVPLMIKKPNIFPEKLPPEPKPEKKKLVNEDGEEVEDAEVKEEKDEDDDEKDDTGESVDPELAAKLAEDKKRKEEEEKASKATMLTIDNYYTSTVGNMLLGIGLSRAKEWFHRDAIKQVHKAIRKEGELEELVDEMKNQQRYYNACKAANSIFVFPAKKCPVCDFKTESSVTMEYHMSIPHLSNKREYKCNYCTFSSRDPRTTVYHFQSVHNKPCVIEPPAQLYDCPICPYDSSQKQKAAAHITKCQKFFVPEKVQLVPDPESELPSITPKPITQDDIKVYENTLASLRLAAQNPSSQVPDIPGLPRGLQKQMLAMQQQQLALQARNRPRPIANKGATGRPIGAQPGGGQAGSFVQTNSGPVPHYGGNAQNFAKSAAPQLYHMLQTGGGHTQLVPISNQQSAQQGAVAKATTQHIQLGKNRFGGLGIPKTQLAGLGGNAKPNMAGRGNIPQQQDASGVSKSGTFVICEICDGYIKDLDQLRTHMQWIHKVKIHPKMLASRPPLNCQKCQWRFFTDQGLERHLLGAHGLVTSNMQDMVNQNQDGGRCTICGRVFASKLVQHMSQVHKITLKPAHLSYKCTVCSATFNLYRLFENHVYMVHSGSVKRNAGGDGDQAAKKQKMLSGNVENKPNGTDHIW